MDEQDEKTVMILVEPTTPDVTVAASRPWYRRQLLIFISGSIFIALILVLVSMALYDSSGAAQLDLSRPGYKAVQDKVSNSDTFESFPATGPVTEKTLKDFLNLYDRQTKPVDNADAFTADTLDNQALGIDAPTAEN